MSLSYSLVPIFLTLPSRTQREVELCCGWVLRSKFRLGERDAGLFKVSEVNRSLNRTSDIKADSPYQGGLLRLDWLDAKVLLVAFLFEKVAFESVSMPISHLRKRWTLLRINTSVGIVTQCKVIDCSVL